MQTTRDPSHPPPASIPSAHHTAAALPCDCNKALALVHPFIGGFLGRAWLVLVVTVVVGHGWEHVMDAICVLLVGPSWAKVTCAAPCLCWVWGFRPYRRHLGYKLMRGDYKGHSKTCCLFCRVPPWWAAKHQPRAHALSAGNALKTENCFQPQEK